MCKFQVLCVFFIYTHTKNTVANFVIPYAHVYFVRFTSFQMFHTDAFIIHVAFPIFTNS